MKQNSQWLSQVRTLSNNAECTSTPSGSPARLSTSTSVSRPPRRISPASRASSTNCRHSSRSRGTSPLTDRISSPSTRPTRAAGEPGATATTRGADIDVAVYGFGGPARRFATRVGARPSRRYAGPMPVDKVLLAAPRGFCAGVEMAIKALVWMVRAFEPPVYCYHEIVHNQLVVERFRDLGVVFVDDIAEVTKVHHEVKVRSGKGYRIVYVGHEGHEEAVGTMAVAPEAIDRVESVAEVDALPPTGQPVALLAQTTLSHRDWSAIAERAGERFPGLWRPGRSDLCFATTNRQSALAEIAPRCDAVVVIGSANSSNTRALEKLAHESGCERVYRVNGPEELPADLHGTVGVTAGASAPEELVDAVIARLDPGRGVDEVRITDEDEYFPPPRELRDLVAGIDVIATFGFGGSVPDRPEINDRQPQASDVLAMLA